MEVHELTPEEMERMIAEIFTEDTPEYTHAMGFFRPIFDQFEKDIGAP
jgi:hypothetical protein